MTERTLDICDPCRDGHHAECAATKDHACECLVCEGERIGDKEFGNQGGNVRR